MGGAVSSIGRGEEQPSYGSCALVVSRAAQFHVRMAAMLGEIGWTCRIASGLPSVSCDPECAAILVDLDSLGALDDVCETLINHRAISSSVPVLLVSATFGRDDFGLTRLAIGDVSLRDPVRSTSLEDALEVAVYNNQVWRARSAVLPDTGARLHPEQMT
jgi:hypothetical protein